MTFYADLSPCFYFGQEEANHLVAIGWLDVEHDYAKGNVSELFIAKLFELFVEPWEPFYVLGMEECPFCTPTSYKLTFNNISIVVGALNLFIPGEGFLYTAPSLIAHYILAHNYMPPQEFRDAVMRCPPMRSPDYFQAIVANGPQSFADEI